MSRIYRRSDRIKVKIDDITVTLAPLTLDQKTECQQALLVGHRKSDLKELTRGIKLSMKYALKDIQGVEDSEGPYKLALVNDELTEDCLDDLTNMQLSAKLTLVCAAMVRGVPSQFTDEENNPIEGVELVKQGKEDAEKKV